MSLPGPKTVGELKIHTETIAAAASSFLKGLADGQYDDAVKVTEELLLQLSVALPPAAAVEKGLEIFLWINRTTAPAHTVSDGRGGYVDVRNSRYDPKTGRFL